MSYFDQITRPTLLVDEAKCRANIQFMANKAKALGIAFRPHFKTHQSATVGEWFREFGVDRIAVSSFSMAKYFAQAGWDNILVAFPVNKREIELINELAGKIHLEILVEDAGTIHKLDKQLKHRVQAWIKVDVGTHRTGIDPHDTHQIDEVLLALNNAEHIAPAGFLAHAGHTYHAHSSKEIRSITHECTQLLSEIKKRYSPAYPRLKISYGDTPGCILAEAFVGVDELRPGNFVYFDLMQHQFGVCSLEQIACAVACPVVALHPSRNEVVLYGGAIHFSKESLRSPDGESIFGQYVRWTENGWKCPQESSYLIRLSQEHGILKASDELMRQLHVGDLVGILPVHSCLAVDCLNEVMTTTGNSIEVLV